MTERRVRRRPGENRERLIEAGLVEFGLSGYHGTATARIAKRADVPQPHVYANFRTKQELFLACLELAAAGLPAPQSQPVAPSPRGPAQGETATPLGGAADGGSAAAARFVFQAIAAHRAAELSDTLTTRLSALRASWGSREFARVLELGARSLLESTAIADSDTEDDALN
ncbi:TetR/AcrR family transcriptional regulator [Leucobacter luti]|uniref:TetR family transcriptional regulator n=1 Tax=Leucobacter luti TaxID=340320 RepID=A0A4Q7TKA7_9MICO|nr:TetR/AcrR family transcriptional regulator [Leucobacter luti]RZT61021.1 TetR family transcriptional regulator [Leucobacter luti]